MTPRLIVSTLSSEARACLQRAYGLGVRRTVTIQYMPSPALGSLLRNPRGESFPLWHIACLARKAGVVASSPKQPSGRRLICRCRRCIICPSIRPFCHPWATLPEDNEQTSCLVSCPSRSIHRPGRKSVLARPLPSPIQYWQFLMVVCQQCRPLDDVTLNTTAEVGAATTHLNTHVLSSPTAGQPRLLFWWPSLPRHEHAPRFGWLSQHANDHETFYGTVVSTALWRPRRARAAAASLGSASSALSWLRHAPGPVPALCLRPLSPVFCSYYAPPYTKPAGNTSATEHASRAWRLGLRKSVLPCLPRPPLLFFFGRAD